MRKLLVAAVLLALTVFGVGYVVGQIRGVPTSSAASNAPTVSNSSTFMHPWAGRWSDMRAASSTAKHADGTVTAINGNTITVKADNDAANSNEYTSVTTIVLTNSTQYNTSGGKSAIKVGSHIFAEGSVSSDGKTMTASQIAVGGAGGCPHGTPSSGTAPGSGSSSPNA